MRESIEAANRADVGWLIEHSAPDVELHARGVAGEPVLYRGAVGAREYFRDMAENWQAVEAVPEDIREVGGRVVALVNRRLRGRGSGVDVEDKIGIVYELRDGLALRIWAYRDVAQGLADAKSDL